VCLVGDDISENTLGAIPMIKRNVLFASWQGGLGHITRDLAVISALRRIRPQIEVHWLSNRLASRVLRHARETVLPESEAIADYNEFLPQLVSGFRFNAVEYMICTQQQWKRNVAILGEVLRKKRFDIIIGDETYEILDALARGELQIDNPFFILEDFVGMLAMSNERIEQIAVQRSNRLFVQQASILRDKVTRIFIGELDDVPDELFGSPPISKREFAKNYYRIIGYIIRFEPNDYHDRQSVKIRLGYERAPLIVCATGGTAAGKELLELCGKAFPILKDEVHDLRMVCVCGESYGSTLPQMPSGVMLFRYIDRLYEHFAACDMAIVVGGGTTTVELTALKRPFIFFPLESQFDQQIYISNRLERHGAGIRMTYKDTSPEKLANVVLENLERKATWQPIATNGAQNAAQIISKSLL
jgi:UDP-N-acetylglucosamine:LPS N-acetylglucosamine transferase